MPTAIERFSSTLSARSGEFAIHLSDDHIVHLTSYYELVMKWTDRLHLVAPCSPEEFATRHVLESLQVLRHLPANASVVDVGSGAGLPMIPCLIVRADLRVTLIEASQKKAVFLREALRLVTNSQPARVLAGRFEETPLPDADFVTCRAIDRFRQVLPQLIKWTPIPVTLLLFTGPVLLAQIRSLLPLVHAEPIPGSEQRFLVKARRAPGVSQAD